MMLWIQSNSFVCNDNYSRLTPGKKDFVSVEKNIHEQKRLLLCNLSELYYNFKQDFPEVKISFFKFCSFTQKWCMTVGTYGPHSVCVCAIHQNVKPMLDAVKLSISYKELIQLNVCDQNNAYCMLQRCDDCPYKSPLRKYLNQVLLDKTDESSHISFNE